MDKRKVRKSIKDLQRIKTWQLLVLLLLAGFISASFLRLNNIGMVERREAVLRADQAGDQATIINRLYDLQQYVSAHMNTDLGRGLYLEASYLRDTRAILANAANDGNANGNIYQLAQQVCAPRFSSYSAAYLQCTTGELAKYPAASDPATSVTLPPADRYRHTYVSPVWSADFAGWSLVVCAILVMIIFTRALSLGVLKLLLGRHYRRVTY